MKRTSIIFLVFTFCYLAINSGAFAQSQCSSYWNPDNYKKATNGVKNFIDTVVGGKSYLFNKDTSVYRSIGFTSTRCPHMDNSKCKPNSWANVGRSYHYPIVNGLYSYYPSTKPRMLFVGQILDSVYFASDIKRALEEKFEVSPIEYKGSSEGLYTFGLYKPYEYLKFSLYDKYVHIRIKVIHPRDTSSGPQNINTTIEYQIVDETKYVLSTKACMEKDSRIKNQGKDLKL